MFRCKVIEIPIYGNEYCKLGIVIADKKGWPLAQKELNKYHDAKNVELHPYSEVKALAIETFSTKSGPSVWILFQPESCTPEVITHEVTHFVNYIFKGRGIKLDPDNDEPQAYFTGWANKIIFKELKKYIKI